MVTLKQKCTLNLSYTSYIDSSELYVYNSSLDQIYDSVVDLNSNIGSVHKTFCLNLNAGIYYIKVVPNCFDYTGCYTITATVPATSISLNTKSTSIIKGKTITLTAKADPSNTTDKVAWKTSNSKVATVTSKGLVKAVGRGTAKITALANSGKSASCTITVKVPTI